MSFHAPRTTSRAQSCYVSQTGKQIYGDKEKEVAKNYKGKIHRVTSDGKTINLKGFFYNQLDTKFSAELRETFPLPSLDIKEIPAGVEIGAACPYCGKKRTLMWFTLLCMEILTNRVKNRGIMCIGACAR